MGLGLSFGFNKSKQKGSSVTNMSKTEATTQSGTTGTDSTQKTTNTQNTTGSLTTAQDVASRLASTTTNVGKTEQAQTSTTKSFGDSVLGGIESVVTNLLGKVLTDPTGRSLAAGGVSQMGQFDVNSFVEKSLAAAQSKSDGTLQGIINGLFDKAGGGKNSQAMLLANAAKNDSEANMAGVAAQLNAQGQGILQANTAAINNVAAGTENFLTQIGQLLKGGVTNTTGTATGTTQEQQNQSQTSNQSTTGQQQSSESTQSQSIQELTQMVKQLLEGTTNTTGTETTKTKGKTSSLGGGMSLGIG